MTGFEYRIAGEGTQLGTGTNSFSTTVFRSGSASWRANPTATNVSMSFEIRRSGAQVNFAQSVRFYMRLDVATNQNSTTLLQTGPSGNTGSRLSIDIAGTLRIAYGDGSSSVAGKSITAGDGVWHRIDIDANGTNRDLYLDGVLIASATGAVAATVQPSFAIGPTGTNPTIDVYFDDVSVFDSNIGAPASGANNQVVLLIPTAGTSAGGWTDGAGGTGDIHGSVDNIPPAGVAAGTAAAKIKNATSTTTGDYVATMQSYIAAGIPPGSTINAAYAVAAHGEEITTGNPKPGAVWISANPSQTAGTGPFEYGNNVVEGTYPTGWPSNPGVVALAPSVTLSTAPTATIRKNLASTRVVGCCFLGIYVDYTPPPIARPVTVLQAVNRASRW